MFEVTQEIDFCYGHRLLNYDGKCRYLHGHNGKVQITLHGEKLDARGMLIDFTDIKRTVQTWIDTNLDHRMILCDQDPVVAYLQQQGEQLYLMPENPTAENIAKHIYLQAKSLHLPVREVTLWETFKSRATFRDE